MTEPVVQCLLWPDLIDAETFGSHYSNNMDSTVIISGWKMKNGKLVQFTATGVMISKRRLITNHHVLPTQEVAKGQYDPVGAISTGAAFRFRGKYAPHPAVFPIKFEPNIFWYTNSELDCTIVAVDTDAVAFVRPTCPPRRKPEEVEKPIYALSHPDGLPLQYSPSGKRVVGCKEYRKRIWYTSEIHPGSSGGGIYDTGTGSLIALVSHEIPSLKVNQGTNIKAIWRDVYDTKIRNMPGDEMYNNLKAVRGQIDEQDLEFRNLCPLENYTLQSIGKVIMSETECKENEYGDMMLCIGPYEHYHFHHVIQGLSLSPLEIECLLDELYNPYARVIGELRVFPLETEVPLKEIDRLSNPYAEYSKIIRMTFFNGRISFEKLDLSTTQRADIVTKLINESAEEQFIFAIQRCVYMRPSNLIDNIVRWIFYLAEKTTAIKNWKTALEKKIETIVQKCIQDWWIAETQRQVLQLTY